MLQYEISAKIRSNFGKGASRSLRRNGQVPAILYGPKADTVALQVETKSFTKSLLNMQRRNAVFHLDIEGAEASAKRSVMVKEVQTNPITDVLVHADFYEISLDVPTELQVQVAVKGNAKGIEQGGELHMHSNTIALKGLILDMPDSIEVDVADIEIGGRVTFGEVIIPEGLELISNEKTTLLSIQLPSASADEDEEEDLEEEAVEEPTAEADPAE